LSTPPGPNRAETSTAAERVGHPERILWIVAAAVGLIVAMTLAVIIVTLNRGFDWSDEGFTYVMIASDREATGEFWGFQHLLNPLYELFGSSILAFRVLRLIGYIALSIALTAIAKAALDALGFSLRRSSWIVVLLVAQVGTFAAWSYPPRYLGYNELSAWLTQLGGAVLILLVVSGRAAVTAPLPRRIVGVLWAVVGFVVASLFVAKISAAIVFGLFALVVALLPASSTRRWTRVGFAAAGAAVALLAMLVVGVPVFGYARSVLGLLVNPAAQAASGYSLSSLLLVYLASASLTLGALAVPVLLAAVTLVFSRGVGRRTLGGARSRAATEHVVLVLAILLMLMVMSIPVFPPGGIGIWDALGVGNTFVYFAAVLAFAILSPRVLRSHVVAGHRTTTMATLVVLFTLIPLVSSLGTNNPILGATVFSTTLWAVGVGVGLVALWERSRASWPILRATPLLLVVAIVAASAFSVAGDVLAHPYRTALYLSQKTPTTVADFRGLRLSEGEVDLIQWLDDSGEELEADGVPALSTASPGALLAFNASGWSNPWPAPDWSDSITRTCLADRPDDLFVLQSENEKPGVRVHDQLTTGLAGCDIRFPDDFERVAHHASENPAHDLTIWRLR
jgi:hypothetical protein